MFILSTILAVPSDLGEWLITLFVLTLVAGIGWQIGRLLNDIIAFVQHAWFYVFKKPFAFYAGVDKKTLAAKERQFLFKQLHFYKFLKPVQRRAFDHRVVRFLETREFVAKDDVELTDEMTLLIAATSVQITFGLRYYMMKEFSRIEVYPDVYYNSELDQYHKGEVSHDGTVILSWKHFKEGVAVPDDNLNLGIHEFAHTLAFQRLNNRAFRDAFFVDAFDKLMRSVSHPAFRKRIQQRAGFRKYALTNPMEFFAVATEVFFENPQQLKSRHPTIYKLFVEMFNQDLAAHFAKGIQPLAH